MSGLERVSSTAPWTVRKPVPADVRLTIRRHQFRASTGTTDLREAQAIRDDLEARWSAEIDRARRGGATVNLAAAKVKIGLGVLSGIMTPSGWSKGSDPWPHAWRRLAGADPTTLTTAPPLALVLASLRHAHEVNDYAHVPGLEAATREMAGVRPDHPQWAELTRIVAEAMLGALEVAERDRLTGAATHALTLLTDDARSNSQAMPLAAAAPAYEVRIGDKTVGELIDAYRAEREARYGEESTARKYAHIFAALEEVLTRETPLRSLTRADGRRVRDFLRRVPAHAGKRFRGLTLTAAIEAADRSKTPVDRISQNTVNSYLSNLSAMLNFAMAEEWIEKNIAAGLVEKDKPKVKRRGFTTDELATVFSTLEDWRRWYHAILLYTGARAAEVAQLRRGDVREEHGVAYLALSEFDATGQRVEDKSLKTKTSTRNVPLHKDLIDAGVLAFLTSKNDPEATVFPLKPTKDGWSHEPSKWFALHLDRVKLTDPALVLHSFRHGFRDAGRRAGLDPTVIDALGGWASANVGERYGDRGMVSVLKREIDRIDYGGFNL